MISTNCSARIRVSISSVPRGPVFSRSYASRRHARAPWRARLFPGPLPCGVRILRVPGNVPLISGRVPVPWSPTTASPCISGWYGTPPPWPLFFRRTASSPHVRSLSSLPLSSCGIRIPVFPFRILLSHADSLFWTVPPLFSGTSSSSRVSFAHDLPWSSRLLSASWDCPAAVLYR